MLKIMGSILVFAAAAGMAGTYKRELADHLALLYALRKLLVIFPATEMEPDSRWKFCWDAL